MGPRPIIEGTGRQRGESHIL